MNLRLKTVCALSATVTLAVPASASETNSLTGKVDKLFSQWNHKDSPGAAIVIVKDGAVVYQQGYGSANLEHHVPISPQTAFDVASVAKQFTGLSVAMLIEQGKLSPDDDIRKLLPDVPDFGKRITVGNLLHHTSGLRDWPETLLLSGIDWDSRITLDTILEMVRRQRELDFSPGEEHLYSNTGYNLLAAAVAKLSGKSFRKWTEANLFHPLGMDHTQVCDDPAEIIPDCAESYAAAGKGKFTRVASMLAAQGSSSLFITAEDMGRWLINLENGRVGGKKAVDMMVEPGKLNSGKEVKYGFGLGWSDYRGLRVVDHGGSWAGYRSETAMFPEKRFAVAILANTANMNPSALAYRIADIYLGLAAEKNSKSSTKKHEAVKADPSSWDSFLGTYRLGTGWLLAITRDGDHLMTQATHEEKFKMTPLSETNFFVDAYSAGVEFVRGPSGTVTNLLYRGINAPKLTLPDLTRAQLATYAGDYWSEELRVVCRIEVRDGQLATCTRAGSWVHLLPIGRDRFDAEFGQFAAEFTRDSNSGITGAKLSGGRIRNIRYNRVDRSVPAQKPVEEHAFGAK